MADEKKTSLDVGPNMARLLKAGVSKEQIYQGRYAIQHVYVTEKEFVVTDGRQLIAVESPYVERLEPGFYDVAGNVLVRSDEQNITFPNYADIWLHKARQLKANADGAVGPAQLFVEFLITAERYLNVWLFEKTVKALDKMDVGTMFFRYNGAERPAMVVCKNVRAKGFGGPSHNFLIKACFMPCTPTVKK